MSRLVVHGFRGSARSVDGGEAPTSTAALLAPVWVIPLWVVLASLVALEAAHELFGLAGPSALYQTWFHEGVVATAAVIVLARAALVRTTRAAWLAFGLAMACWATGSISWSIVYGGRSSPPYPTFADVLWLAWYPLMAIGIWCLIRIHLPHFELHRWMDGLAVTLVALGAGFAIVVEPVASHTSQGILATVVDFSYPVLDILLIGAVLGVYGLLGWRPDRMWILIGLGTLATTAGDAAFAVQEARGVASGGQVDFVWPLGALFIAWAAWVVEPPVHRHPHRVTGLRAVALPLLAQGLAAGIQVYALFRPLGWGDRVVTLAVLAVASVQIILTRPRASPADRPTAPDGTTAPGRPTAPDQPPMADIDRTGRTNRGSSIP